MEINGGEGGGSTRKYAVVVVDFRLEKCQYLFGMLRSKVIYLKKHNFPLTQQLCYLLSCQEWRKFPNFFNNRLFSFWFLNKRRIKNLKIISKFTILQRDDYFWSQKFVISSSQRIICAFEIFLFLWKLLNRNFTDFQKKKLKETVEICN